MGVVIQKMGSYYEYGSDITFEEYPNQVLNTAEKSLNQILETPLPDNITHLIVATTCPDSIAPSLGQSINEKYQPVFSNCHVIDLVQGCAGGASAMILGSQLAELHQSSVVVVLSDAARKATSKKNKHHHIFGNGSFSCIISYSDSSKKLLHYKSEQYKELLEVVTVKLGHDAGYEIQNNKNFLDEPIRYLGLNMNNTLAIKLLKKAEDFYDKFVQISGTPDIMILHQVNPTIIRLLKTVFSKNKIYFADTSNITGNCGTASIGIALDIHKTKVQDKKVLICSFGTGGVITAGMWQM
ncbi:3-oxoacyl-[acyl-carrier-protein] synthase III C-terminal domain-containing protein [Mangrovibacterium lignilyticum]|uniref:3-oxoacyl-[acyl-carrier-protein] synthase III C-terminal domain-containing protein n=1 Tax=Mangrovibacterium lignilyticum TaxID=2668052 RepID=UPI0013D84B8C|nr:3-oxoacyl-[acyl-carrier-protein] synthase III C-terminal domain-containing protein [Mangrovibacterium lignilyticum]